MSEDIAPLTQSKTTRYLGDLPNNRTVTPRRVTGPLDQAMPWVLEFRVVGTPSMLQVRVSEVMTIGRADLERGIIPDVNLSPYEAHVQGVSRKHAVMLAQDNTIMVKDLGSANGTQLNGLALKPDQPYRLRHGDELTFGRLSVQVLFSVVPLVRSAQDTVPTIGSGQHILLIEEDKDTASVLSMILEQAGFRVSLATTGLLAMGLLQHELPDAVLLDLMLSDMDGVQVANFINTRRSARKALPLLAISSATGGFQRSQALGAGADEFLGKPVNVDELTEALVRMMPKMMQAI